MNPQLITETLEEQSYLLEQDYKFQLDRLQQAHKEELDKLREVEDQLRNDNYQKAKRNYEIVQELKHWDHEIQRDLEQKIEDDPENAQEDQDFQMLDKTQYKIQDVIYIMEPIVEQKYTEKNPIIEELQKELEFLQRENRDLYERSQKLDQEIYNDPNNYKINPFDQFSAQTQKYKIPNTTNRIKYNYATPQNYDEVNSNQIIQPKSLIEQNNIQNQQILEEARQIVAKKIE